MDLHQAGSGEGSDHLQLIKFWPSCAPGRCLRRGENFWLRLLQQCLHLCEHFFFISNFIKPANLFHSSSYPLLKVYNLLLSVIPECLFYSVYNSVFKNVPIAVHVCSFLFLCQYSCVNLIYNSWKYPHVCLL